MDGQFGWGVLGRTIDRALSENAAAPNMWGCYESREGTVPPARSEGFAVEA